MFPISNSVSVRYPPITTWGLIAVNCAVFFFQLQLSGPELQQFLADFALIPARYFDPGTASGISSPIDLLPFVSNMFLHGGWLHLIVNMWTLWLFGPAVEDRLGSGRYLLFYLVCGVLASVTHAVFNPDSTLPALGASGAIAGVLGCYVRMFPFAEVTVVVLIIFLPLFFHVPALVFVGLWFAMQLLQVVTHEVASMTGGGIAWWAHIGGFVVGLLLAGVLAHPGRRNWPERHPDQQLPSYALLGRN